MIVKSLHEFYNVSVSLDDTGGADLGLAIEYLQNFCGGFVWCECETTQQALPKYAKFVGTFYGINVYFDPTTEQFLFEDFN